MQVSVLWTLLGFLLDRNQLHLEAAWAVRSEACIQILLLPVRVASDQVLALLVLLCKMG